ncbi:MAG: glycosyltransferase family 39 protein, partial [Candidatus Neomicrothrix subdominans]
MTPSDAQAGPDERPATGLRARLSGLAGEPLAWVGVIVATFGVIARAWVISGPMGTPDLDAATVGIQAQQFLDGHLQVFFLDQPYGGTLEVAMVAAAFAVGGVNVAMMKLVPLALHAVAVVLTWRIARRVTDDRLARFLAPCLLWIFPAGMLWNSTKQRGFYGIAIVLAALTLLFALRVVQEGTATADLVVLGLVAGLGWWTTPLLAPIALASGGWALIESPAARRRLAWLVIPAVLGATPWLGWNAVNGWESLSGGRAEG